MTVQFLKLENSYGGNSLVNTNHIVSAAPFKDGGKTYVRIRTVDGGSFEYLPKASWPGDGPLTSFENALSEVNGCKIEGSSTSVIDMMA